MSYDSLITCVYWRVGTLQHQNLKTFYICKKSEFELLKSKKNFKDNRINIYAKQHVVVVRNGNK